MKKYVYILLLLASVSTLATAQIKIGNYTFKDGGEYTGELKGRKPNGKGKTIYKNGNTYEGEYIKGKREGNGTYTFHVEKSMWGNGSRTSNTAAEPIIL